MRYFSRDQSQPIHMHWEIHRRHVSSDRTHEDNSRANPGISVVRERRSEFPRGVWDDPCHCWDDMV